MKYIDLCEIYNKLDSTSKRLEKTYYVSQLIKKTKDEEIPLIMLMLEGRVFPAWDKRKVGMASRSVLKAINIATGIDNARIEEKWKKTGDLGLVAEEYIGKKKQATLFSQDLSLNKVFSNLQKLAELEGIGTVDRKVKLVAELLTSAKPLEAKYIIRTVLEDLRIGVGQGSIRDAIVWAQFPLIANLELSGEGNKYYYMDKDKPIEIENIKVEKVVKNKCEFEKISILKTKSVACENKEQARELFNFFVESVEEAYNITNDWSEVVLIVRKDGMKGLKNTDIKIGKPIKVMLYQKAHNIKDAFERVGKPCALEFKYDGFRLEIHVMENKKHDKNNQNQKYEKEIKLFTRGFEDVTEQFPDVVEYVRKYVDVKDVILDSEVVGYNKKTTQYMAFQSISQRIKRKYDIKELSERFPVEVNVFDILYHNGKSLLKEEFHKRRALLGKIVDSTHRKIVLSRIMITDKEEEANKFYQASLDAGNEGIMAKNLNAVYKPGSRVGFGVKVKPVMESLDLVIVGAEWGEGKRSAWLTSFLVACKDEEGNLVEIGKVGTGIKELEDEGVTFNQLTEMLKPHIKSEKGKSITVKPTIVIEVHYEEIQKSPTYSSGFALRFPRFVRLREDRDVDDISDIGLVKDLYGGQRGRN